MTSGAPRPNAAIAKPLAAGPSTQPTFRVRPVTASAKVLRRLWDASLVASALVVAAVLAVLRRVVAMPDLSATAELLRYVVIGVAAALVIVAWIVRARVPPLETGADAAAWWRAHLHRAVVVWALSEGIALYAAVVYLLTGDAVALAVAGGGIVSLVLTRPAVLEGA